MIDIKLIRENPDEIKKKLNLRGNYGKYVDEIFELDKQRRITIKTIENLKNIRNEYSHGISILKIEDEEKYKQKINELYKIRQVINEAIHEYGPYLTHNLVWERNRIDEILSEASKISHEIKMFDEGLRNVESEITKLLWDIPNLPHDAAPIGKTPEDNIEIKRWGEKPNGDFKFLDHVELGRKNNILSFEIGARLAGSGFPFYKGKGAILERALINFMLDSHRKNGYTEVLTPFLANRASMEAAEKVPKFEYDMYRIDEDDLFAIPTAEVPILNIHRDEIMKFNELPIRYCGYTACFRREAGSYGKETKGFLRVHEFNKVELVTFCLPENSDAEMEEMLKHACGILEELNIHYRVLDICTADAGFSAGRQYDIETWSPAENKWLEASSVSNCTDFQSRRAQIRFKRPEQKAKTEFVHILNGSGLATSRLMVSLLESYQTPEGKIIVPKALHKYTGFEVIG